MSIKKININLTNRNTLSNYIQLKKLNNSNFTKLEDWNKHLNHQDLNYFMGWKKETLLCELDRNPNFIYELTKTHNYKILRNTEMCLSNHPTVPYLNKFLPDNLSDKVHFFLTKINQNVITSNWNIVVPSPGNITYDLGLNKYDNWLSNVLIKVNDTTNDKLLEPRSISKSYTFPYNYQLVNTKWVDYDITIDQLGVETLSPIFSLDKIHSIENYCSYLSLHPSNVNDYLINALTEINKLSMDLIWLNTFYNKYSELQKLNSNLSEVDIINFIEDFTIVFTTSI